MSVSIPLTRGLTATVDDEDGWLAERTWQAHSSGHGSHRAFYAASGRYPTRVFMHRLVAGAAIGQLVDHINGDTLDNRRANLRIATHQQNLQNMRRTRGESRFRGVFRDRRYPTRWYAHIRVDGHARGLGGYATEIEAAQAYDAAACRYFGAFACLNRDLFPELVRATAEDPDPEAMRVAA